MTPQTQTTQTSNMQDTHDDIMLHGEQRQQHNPSAGEVAGHAQLTPALHAGAEVLQQQAEDIVMQIEELTRVGVDFIDQLKQEFLGRMTEARQQIEVYSATQTREWEMQSQTTIDLQKRLQAAGQLMGNLEARFHGR